jgi:hypothetical protein
MRSILLSIIFVTIHFIGLSVQADSFYIDRDGHRYLCEQVSGGGGGGSCWEQCPWTFDTCAGNCGGGSECWDKCPWTFDTCAGSCGGGSSCWSKCPWTFDTCSRSCGSNGLTPNALQRILNTNAERAQFEKLNRTNQ